MLRLSQTYTLSQSRHQEQYVFFYKLAVAKLVGNILQQCFLTNLFVSINMNTLFFIYILGTDNLSFRFFKLICKTFYRSTVSIRPLRDEVHNSQGLESEAKSGLILTKGWSGLASVS